MTLMKLVSHLISKGAVTTGHDKCRFVDSLNDDSTTSVQSETVSQLDTHADVKEELKKKGSTLVF